MTQVASPAMGVDRDESPSVQSVSSQPAFIDDYENLPAGGPISHAHIIDLSEQAAATKIDGPLQLQDAIVTSLFQASPEILKQFLNPTINTIKVVFGKKDKQFVIWRKGIEVLVGTFEHHIALKVYGFEHLAGFLIGYDGSWHLKITAANAYSNPKWPDVWAGKFESYGGVAKMSVEIEEAGMAKRAHEMATAILADKYWELKVDVKTT
ncbi:hypothetical protein ACN47E_005379 [Coniothyrium glycines]